MDWGEKTASTQVIHPTAQIGPGCSIGPFVVVGPHVEIGENTRIEGFCSIGTRPEHRGHWGSDSIYGVSIGPGCVLREFTTVNSGTTRTTRLGHGVVMLRGSHVGHDAHVDDQANISCDVLVGGHCYVGQGANLGLGAVVHQFRAIGGYSMIGMNSTVTKDVDPFSTWFGSPAKKHGANKVGVERAGLSWERISHWMLHCGPQFSDYTDFLSVDEARIVMDWVTRRVHK